MSVGYFFFTVVGCMGAAFNLLLHKILASLDCKTKLFQPIYIYCEVMITHGHGNYDWRSQKSKNGGCI